MSECYCDFDQYMTHVKQMVYTRPQHSHHYHLGICPTMVPRLIFQGKECCQVSVITIYCNQVLLKDSVRDKTLSARMGLIHNISDV